MTKIGQQKRTSEQRKQAAAFARALAHSVFGKHFVSDAMQTEVTRSMSRKPQQNGHVPPQKPKGSQ